MGAAEARCEIADPADEDADRDHCENPAWKAVVCGSETGRQFAPNEDLRDEVGQKGSVDDPHHGVHDSFSGRENAYAILLHEIPECDADLPRENE